MTEIATEDDLWKLFFKKPTKHGYKKKGDGAVYYQAFKQVLDAKTFGPDGNKRLVIEDPNRLYLVGRLGTTAVVRQCDLREVARAINSSGGGDAYVAYLGITQE